MNDDLNEHITKWLRPHTDAFFGVPSLEEIEMDFDETSGPQWEPREARDDTYAPRVIPPERKPRPRVPMAHDGGPGLKDGKHASRIKYLLREFL